MTFGARMAAARKAYGPLCVGLDPHREVLQNWGLEDSVSGLQQFATIVVEAFAGKVAFVKPQSAFFERFGAAGVGVLQTVLQQFRHTGTLTILDVKRGDIGSTAAAYASAYLDEDAPMATDAITVSPYLGFGSLEPFFIEAERNDAGVFVLALTSNPEGPEFQHARTGSGTVATSVLSQLAQLNSRSESLGSFGAVVGATIDRSTNNTALAHLDINGPLLVPGLGAQGGTPTDLHELFGEVFQACLPASARGVLAAGPDPAQLAAAAADLNAQLVRFEP